jgi:hypothetical protein
MDSCKRCILFETAIWSDSGDSYFKQLIETLPEPRKVKQLNVLVANLSRKFLEIFGCLRPIEVSVHQFRRVW